MAKGNNSKLKLWYLANIMLENTDETHYMTMSDIITELAKLDISAERKSIYTDFEELERFGLSVEGVQIGKKYCYHVVDKQFELAELKLLVDSIQSSKFITAKKTTELIKKLERFCSKYEARQLQRQVYVQNRIKTMNESIYYTVDAIHMAIVDNKKISFKYFNWNTNKEIELRKGGKPYIVSPWALNWDDENYYLVAFDDESKSVRHYRVDKMLSISVLEESREGAKVLSTLDTADYSRKSFGMYAGEDTIVKLLVPNEMAGIMIDRFGKEISFVPYQDGLSTVRVKVSVSPQFFGWIFALEGKVKIIEPQIVVDKMNEQIKKFIN